MGSIFDVQHWQHYDAIKSSVYKKTRIENIENRVERNILWCVCVCVRMALIEIDTDTLISE